MMINKSKAYILPLLNQYIKIKFVKDIINTFLFLNNDLTNYIIVQYKENDSDTAFNNYLIDLGLQEHCLDIITKDGYVYCIFSVDESIKSDYNNFIDGKYSHFSEHHKKRILSFSVSNYGHSSLKVISELKQILYKDEKLREKLEEELGMIIPEHLELTSIPDLQKETLILE